MKKDMSILKELHEQGHTINSLAIDFGISRKTVEKLIRETGGVKKNRAEITRDRIQELKDPIVLSALYEEHGSLEKLAKHLGTSSATIRVVFDELGIKILSQTEAMANTRKQIDEQEVIRLYETGLSANKVAAKFGVSDTVIRRILKEAQVNIRSREEQLSVTPKKDDTNAKLAKRLRSRLYCALAGKAKTGSAIGDLGCSLEEARKYIESQFYSCPDTNRQMSWGNYGNGGWEIDHIEPLSKFDLTDVEQFKQSCNYKNLQPLWCSENRKKSNK